MSTFVSKASLNFVQIMGNDIKRTEPKVRVKPNKDIYHCSSVFSPFSPFSLLLPESQSLTNSSYSQLPTESGLMEVK